MIFPKLRQFGRNSLLRLFHSLINKINITGNRLHTDVLERYYETGMEELCYHLKAIMWKAPTSGFYSAGFQYLPHSRYLAAAFWNNIRPILRPPGKLTIWHLVKNPVSLKFWNDGIL